MGSRMASGSGLDGNAGWGAFTDLLGGVTVPFDLVDMGLLSFELRALLGLKQDGRGSQVEFWVVTPSERHRGSKTDGVFALWRR